MTSDEIEFFDGTKKVKSFYKNPVLVVRLKPGEAFEFSAKADKGIALNHSRYSVVGMCAYEMVNEDEFIFKMEPRGQLKIDDILDRACQIIKFRLGLMNYFQEDLQQICQVDLLIFSYLFSFY